MNDLTHSGFGGDAPPRMTSLEMAELTGKRHDNVRRTIETLVEGKVIACPQIEDVQEIRGNNRTYTTQAYVFVGEQGKRDSYVVVAQLSPEFTARLVDRWQELEGQKQTAQIDVRNLPQLQTIALQLIEVNKEQSEQIAVMTPKVEAFDRIANTDGSFCITDAAKTLQMRPKDLFARLREDRWIYTRAGKSDYVAHAPKLDAGLLEHKTTTVSRTDGSEKSVTQVRVTPKGLAKLAAIFSEGAAH